MRPTLILSILLLSPTPASAQTLLRWKFTEGQTLKQSMETKTTTTATLGGQALKTMQTMVVDSLRTTKKVLPSGNAQIQQKSERVHARLDGPGGQVLEFDSREKKDLEGPFGEILNPVLGALAQAEVPLELTPQGKREKFELPRGLLDALKSAPGDSRMSSFFSEESVRQMLDALPSFPDGPLALGTTWTEHVKLPMPFGTLHIDQTYRYEGKETKDGRELHKIGLKSGISFQKKEGAPFEMKVKPNEATGVLYFDSEAGRFTSMSQTQNVTMEISAPGAPTVESHVETVITYRLEEAKSEETKK